MKSRIKLLALLLILAVPTITFGQSGLLGSWKYVSPSGEMTMQINSSTIVINSKSFPQAAQGRDSRHQLCQADGCSRASRDSWYLSFYQPISSPLTVKQHSTS